VIAITWTCKSNLHRDMNKSFSKTDQGKYGEEDSVTKYWDTSRWQENAGKIVKRNEWRKKLESTDFLSTNPYGKVFLVFN
jgi:hypothetical protein